MYNFPQRWIEDAHIHRVLMALSAMVEQVDCPYVLGGPFCEAMDGSEPVSTVFDVLLLPDDKPLWERAAVEQGLAVDRILGHAHFSAFYPEYRDPTVRIDLLFAMCPMDFVAIEEADVFSPFEFRSMIGCLSRTMPWGLETAERREEASRTGRPELPLAWRLLLGLSDPYPTTPVRDSIESDDIKTLKEGEVRTSLRVGEAFIDCYQDGFQAYRWDGRHEHAIGKFRSSEDEARRDIERITWRKCPRP